MALDRYSGTAPVAGSTVSVFETGTQVLADLYEDLDGLVPMSNPFTADTESGAYTYVAESAVYDVSLVAQSAVPLDPTPELPTVVFAGTPPDRTATLYAIDPDDGASITLVQVRL